MDRNNFDRAYLAIQQFLKGWMEEVLEEHYSQVQMEFSTPTFDLGPSVRKEVWALCKYLSLHKNGIPALACDILQMYLSIYLKQRKDLTPGSDRWNAAVSFINNRSSLFISIGVAIAAKIDDAGNFTSFDTVIPFFPDMVIYTKKDIAIIQWEILRTTGRQIPSWDTVDIALLIATMLELPNEWNHIITYTMDIAEYNRSQIGTDLQIASVGLFYGAQKLWRLHLAAAAVLVTIRRHCIMYKHLLNRISRLTETSEIRIMRISDLIIKHFNKRP